MGSFTRDLYCQPEVLLKFTKSILMAFTVLALGPFVIVRRCFLLDSLTAFEPQDLKPSVLDVRRCTYLKLDKSILTGHTLVLHSHMHLCSTIPWLLFSHRRSSFMSPKSLASRLQASEDLSHSSPHSATLNM